MRFGSLAQWVECSLMVRTTRVQSQVESYQRLKKSYLIPPCLTLRNIRYVSRVKWSNPWKGVAPSSTPRCSSYWKGSFRIALDYSRHLTLLCPSNDLNEQNLERWTLPHGEIKRKSFITYQIEYRDNVIDFYDIFISNGLIDFNAMPNRLGLF